MSFHKLVLFSNVLQEPDQASYWIRIMTWLLGALTLSWSRSGPCGCGLVHMWFLLPWVASQDDERRVNSYIGFNVQCPLVWVLLNTLKNHQAFTKHMLSSDIELDPISVITLAEIYLCKQFGNFFHALEKPKIFFQVSRNIGIGHLSLYVILMVLLPEEEDFWK